MLATLGGTLALVLGLGILLLPLLATELSRPRDSVWGAVVLLLGLVLVTSADRLAGAPMLAVVSGGLLIGRLGGEVAQGRWRQLTEEERGRLGTAERWRSSLAQLGRSLLRLLEWAGGAVSALGGWIAGLRGRRPTGKRWVRPELPAAAGGTGVAEAGEQVGAGVEETPGGPAEPAPVKPAPGEPRPPQGEGPVDRAGPPEAPVAEAPAAEAPVVSPGTCPEEPPGDEPPGEATPVPPGGEGEDSLPGGDDLVVVSDFGGVEALLEQAVPPGEADGPAAAAAEAMTGRDNPPLPPPQP